MSGKRRIALTVLLGAAALLSASMLAPAFGAPKAVSAVSLAKKLAATIDDREAGGPQRQARDQGPPGPAHRGPGGTRRRARPARGERRPGCQRRQGRQGRSRRAGHEAVGGHRLQRDRRARVRHRDGDLQGGHRHLRRVLQPRRVRLRVRREPRRTRCRHASRRDRGGDEPVRRAEGSLRHHPQQRGKQREPAVPRGGVLLRGPARASGALPCAPGAVTRRYAPRKRDARPSRSTSTARG